MAFGGTSAGFRVVRHLHFRYSYNLHLATSASQALLLHSHRYTAQGVADSDAHRNYSVYVLSAPSFAKSLVTNSVALYSAVLP